jgi:inorganic pyrophosphatase
MPGRSKPLSPFAHITPFDDEGDFLNVIIETPKGSRIKFKYDEDLHLFTVNRVLQTGAVFPLDFGFVPGTRASDGDPLDVLVLLDAPAFPGCHVSSRLIGVLEAEQTEKGETIRNDRLVTVAEDSHLYKDVLSLDDVPENILAEIEYFFVTYNVARGREFETKNRGNARRARQLVEEGIQLFRHGTRGRSRGGAAKKAK